MKKPSLALTVSILWIFRILAALIMLQTLYFKFSAQPESVHLFTTLGMEPWGRIGIGSLELVASALILYPRTTPYGALLGLGLMAGAIFFHLTKLGIRWDGDYTLFAYAVIAFISCAVLIIAYRNVLLQRIGIIKS
ncbi:DoxX family protein [Flavitalea sp. BT771]|uniref:DoxX family protein n=1 Tax=Flavitalea sp. BT771 TaxID=3063329 RepID=UPI0026E2EEEA|nr:DoxX family protein [Flavitalea sp. BT771]MDO6431615.1 DoxX family protein [Flavitalea sp. BT771]MDV6220523.1 DoxX family protein [Flavitalea sp. BT771]